MNKNDKSYKYYGARGIVVCESWRDSFEHFYEWSISNGYSDDLTIERIDVNGNYDPSNCKWITQKEQARNKRNNHRVEIDGNNLIITDWAKLSPVTATTIYQRLKDGCDVKSAIMTPDKRKSIRIR
jgi:hypothetical protein